MCAEPQNLLFGITLFVINAFTTFSGQYIYSDVYMTLFNVLFTSLTPIIIGVFDKDVDREMGMKYPALYKQGVSTRACCQLAAGQPLVYWYSLSRVLSTQLSRSACSGQRNDYFNFYAIIGWLCTAVLQCGITMVLVLYGCRPTVINRQTGHPYGSYEASLG